MSESKKALIDLGGWVALFCLVSYGIFLDIQRMDAEKGQPPTACQGVSK